jgi:hypothetical protein
MVMLFPMMGGEITPIIVGFVIGFLFGTQVYGKVSRRTVAMIICLCIVGAFLFQAPVFTWSLVGGYIAEGLSFAAPFISATIGILLGWALRGGK